MELAIYYTIYRCLGIDCLDDKKFDILCKGRLHLDTLDLSGSLVTDQW